MINKYYIQMRTTAKIGFIRPTLAVQTAEYQKKIREFKERDNVNEVVIKPLRSVKNLHQLRKFNFWDQNVQAIDHQRRLKKLGQLQNQKKDLMRSLQILKISAVSAIAEKQQQIQKLRGRDIFNGDERLQFYHNQLQRSKRIRFQLEQEREQLHREKCEERSRFIRQIQQKETIIQQLFQEIQEIRRELELLQQNQTIKTKKIRLLQQQNSQLSIQLELSTISCSHRDSDRIDLDETLKLGSTMSVASSIRGRSCFQIDNSHLFENEGEKTNWSEKLQQIDKKHKQEVLELRQFYEKRIEGLRQIYMREERLPSLQSEGYSELKSHQHKSHEQKSHSHSRSKSSGSCKVDYSRSPPKQSDSQTGRNLNTKQMYSIEQKVQNQLQTSRSKPMNLKYEIKMQSLSDCPSVEDNQKQMYTNQDAGSEFTTKYFQNPFKFRKYNSSHDNESGCDELQVRTVHRNKQTAKQIQNWQEYQQESFSLQKSCIFAAGLLSGVTITSIVGFILKLLDK